MKVQVSKLIAILVLTSYTLAATGGGEGPNTCTNKVKGRFTKAYDGLRVKYSIQEYKPAKFTSELAKLKGQFTDKCTTQILEELGVKADADRQKRRWCSKPTMIYYKNNFRTCRIKYKGKYTSKDYKDCLKRTRKNFSNCYRFFPDLEARAKKEARLPKLPQGCGTYSEATYADKILNPGRTGIKGPGWYRFRTSQKTAAALETKYKACESFFPWLRTVQALYDSQICFGLQALKSFRAAYTKERKLYAKGLWSEKFRDYKLMRLKVSKSDYLYCKPSEINGIIAEVNGQIPRETTAAVTGGPANCDARILGQYESAYRGLRNKYVYRYTTYDLNALAAETNSLRGRFPGCKDDDLQKKREKVTNYSAEDYSLFLLMAQIFYAHK